MKNIIKISSILLCFVLCFFSLIACDGAVSGETGTSSTTIETVETSAPETTSPETSAPDSTVEPKPDPITPLPDVKKPSLIELDIEKYLSLDYKGLELSVKELPKEITAEDVEKEIKDLLTYEGKYTLITDRVTAEGDILEISYVGTMDGKEFDGGKSDNATILLDKGNSGYIDGFADVLFGVACGETVTANITFPEDYYEELAGKPVTFKITVKGIRHFELTDEIAKELSDGKVETADDYRARVKEYLELNQKHTTIDEVYDEMWDLLIKKASVTEIYDPLYQFYHTDFVNSIIEYANYYGISYEECLKTLGFDENKIIEASKESAIGDMIIYYIAAKEGLSVTEDECKEYLEDYVEYYKEQGMDYTVESLEKELEDYYGEGYVYTQLLSGEVIFAVFDSATIVERPASNT
jgi:trigger factor